MRHQAGRCITMVVGVIALSSCALDTQMLEIAQKAENQSRWLQHRHERFGLSTTDPEIRLRRQRVGQPWVAGRVQPLARDISLPPALHQDVPTTLLFADDRLTLPEIAQRITQATDIPVHVRTEALLPAENFMPKLAQAATVRSDLGLPQTMHLLGQDEPLANILDRVAATLNVSWTYRNQRIEFYRTETRVFNVRVLTLEAQAEASLGLRRDQGSSDAFASTSQTRLRASSDDVMDVIRARIEPFLTQAGVLIAQSGASHSIVVTDTPEVLEEVARYIERENQVMTRRVRLVFEEVTLATRDGSQASLDWDVIFSSARMAARAAMGGTSLVDAGMVTAELARGPFAGSEAMVSALAEAGRVVRRSSVPVLTLNRRPVTHAVRSTFSYIDRLDTTTYSDAAGHALPALSVSQKEETVGSLLTLLPDAQDDGRILLSIAYDNTVAQPLKSIRFGDRANPLQLQQITIDGNGTVQQLLLQPGQPVLISGFDRSEMESEARRSSTGLTRLFGGADRASQEQLVTVLIVTAHIEEGV